MAQLSSNDSKKVWKTVKVINTSEQSIPTLQANGVTLETAESKAEALNQYFYSTFNHCYPDLQPCDMEDLIGDLVPSDCPEELFCSEDKVRFS